MYVTTFLFKLLNTVVRVVKEVYVISMKFVTLVSVLTIMQVLTHKVLTVRVTVNNYLSFSVEGTWFEDLVINVLQPLRVLPELKLVKKDKVEWVSKSTCTSNTTN
jgi:hypothetical protein